MERAAAAGRAVCSRGRLVLAEARRRRLALLAGSLAFHAFISLLPLLVLLLLVVSRVAGDAFAAYLVELTRQYLSPSGQTLLANAIQGTSGQFGSSVLSVLVFLWSSVRIFWNLEVVFEELYGTSDGKSTGRQFRDGAAGVVGILVAVLSVIVGGVAVATVPFGWLAVLNPLLLLVWLSTALLPLYYFFPPVEVSLVEVVPGAVVAAGGWAVVQVAFQVYVETTPAYAAFGALGGVILLLIWLYFGALVTLLGAVVNVVLAGRVE
jgi:membrane protein